VIHTAPPPTHTHLRLLDRQEAVFSPLGSLRILGEVAQTLGDMTVPSLLLVLGANLASGPGSAGVPAATIIAITIGRLVMLPVLGVVTVLGASRMGWLASMDRTSVFVLLLMWAVPSALMIHSVSTMFQNKPDEVAAILFW